MTRIDFTDDELREIKSRISLYFIHDGKSWINTDARRKSILDKIPKRIKTWYETPLEKTDIEKD